ncbi:PLOD3, partial [Symbiodinium necroappetens]
SSFAELWRCGAGLRRNSTGARAAKAAMSSSSRPVHVLACATEYRQETAILQRSAARNGFRFHTVGLGEPWKGFATKFLAYERTLRRLLDTTLQPEDLVMLLDAWDTVILAPADELRAKLTAIPPKTILGGTERVCGPNHFLV